MTETNTNLTDLVPEGASGERRQSIFPRGEINPGDYQAFKTRLLTEWEIDPGNPLTPPEELLRLRNEPLLLRKRMAIICGSAGSRKTTLLTLLTASLLGYNTEGLHTNRAGLRGIYIDTEQAPDQTQRILNRVMRHAGDEFNPESLRIFNILRVPEQYRGPLIEDLIESIRPDFVILDNLTDLIGSTLDDREAQSLAQRIRALSDDFDLCIIGVIHSNESKTDKSPRGWTGKEFSRKGDCSLYVESMGETSKVSIIKFRDGRAPDSFQIHVSDSDGTPRFGDPTGINGDDYVAIVKQIPDEGVSPSELKNLIEQNNRRLSRGTSTAAIERIVTEMRACRIISKQQGRYYVSTP